LVQKSKEEANENGNGTTPPAIETTATDADA